MSEAIGIFLAFVACGIPVIILIVCLVECWMTEREWKKYPPL